MRKIEFRVWDGEGMIYLSPTGIQQFDFENGYVLSFSDEGYKQFYAHECYPKAKCDYPVMQYAGLKDKNGKEIYEGDIVSFKTSEQGKQEEFYERKEIVSFYRGVFDIGAGKLYEWSHESGSIDMP